MKLHNPLLLLVLILLVLAGCKKQNEWLEEPRTKDDVVIKSIRDLQELLNNTSVFNLSIPASGLIGTDNIWVRESELVKVPAVEKNSYLWRSDIYEGQASNDYFTAYKGVLYANIVLEYADRLKGEASNPSEFDEVKGQAYFYRAYMYSEIVNLFCKPYDMATAANDLGICIKLSADVNEIAQRSTVQASYDQIISDALASSRLLSSKSLFKTQPTKIACWGLLSRVYLNMGNYEKSLTFADSVLKYNAEIIDFNIVPSLNLPYRFPDFKSVNSEIIWYAEANGYALVFPNEVPGFSGVDTILYKAYDDNDLRKVYFYKKLDQSLVKFLGGYTGKDRNFSGIAVNEILLIRAECLIRLNRIEEGLVDLNSLLARRFRKGTYVDFETSDSEVALDKVLLERRKELPFTGQIRWQDLRRTNLEPRLATSIFRKVSSEVIELKPNDPKYVFPFPQIEIDKAGIVQNPR
ncbi:RagB/SusD family nutrient uptake outer membrane protein [Chitinophaga rhizosphaerae]|uniref:RagB/SusD family nutrient uptake outer membrane protein n=1 Tax=Chitinophaga rhizosphaerae TaxID=1864947 RepID=UPI000F80F88D|nr:RagB/SusD family nutrient uptake outer membrane protein [Chitinophaga rhizosphaerae]